MTLLDVPDGSAVFIDSGILISYFTADPARGPACEAFLEKVENKQLFAFTAAHVLGETAHRLMTIEARQLFGWTYQNIAQKLRKSPDHLKQLVRYQQAIDEVPLFPIEVLPVVDQRCLDRGHHAREGPEHFGQPR